MKLEPLKGKTIRMGDVIYEPAKDGLHYTVDVKAAVGWLRSKICLRVSKLGLLPSRVCEQRDEPYCNICKNIDEAFADVVKE